MPNLNVTVDGKKYSISGLTRKTCSKQILCALAKINEDIGVIKSGKEPELTSSSSDESPSNDFGAKERGERKTSGGNTKPRKRKSESVRLERQLHEMRRDPTKVSSRKKRESLRQIEEEKRPSSSTSTSMENLLSLIEAQRKCLHVQQEQLEHKDKAIRHCLYKEKSTEFQHTRTVVNGGLEEKAEPINLKQETTSSEFVKDTDHDTGISEQTYSDSSNEVQTAACSSSEGARKEQYDVKKGANLSASHDNSASSIFYTEHTPKAAMHDVPHGNQNQSYANNLSSTAESPKKGECTEYFSNDSEKKTSKDSVAGMAENRDGIFKEMHKVMESLASAEAKFAEQSKLIEVLKNLTAHVENSAKLQRAQAETSREHVEEEIENVQKSLSLSNHLYEYQKQEIQTNAVKLQHVESKVSRKRWHVESLLQELENLRLSPTRGRSGLDSCKRSDVSVETGTLV